MVHKLKEEIMKAILTLLIGATCCSASDGQEHPCDSGNLALCVTKNVFRSVQLAAKETITNIKKLRDNCEVTESCMDEIYIKEVSMNLDSSSVNHRPAHLVGSNSSSSINNSGNQTVMIVDQPLALGKQAISIEELEAISKIRSEIALLAQSPPTDVSPWLFNSCTDIDIARFVRLQRGNVEKSWDKLLRHAKWRISPNGADTLVRENAYRNSVLHEEVFWFGVDSTGCPTVVGRTMLHDGSVYDEIPQRFTNFLVLLIEEGRQKYGVGSERMACILLDRFPVITKGALKKQEVFDLSIIPNIVALIRSIYTTFQDNYPEIFEKITVTPASWFFSSCFKITSRVFDQKTRDMFQMVNERDTKELLPSLFQLTSLPLHMGGTATIYGPVIVRSEPELLPTPSPTPGLTSLISMRSVCRAVILLWYPVQLYSCEFHPTSIWCAKLHKVMR